MMVEMHDLSVSQSQEQDPLQCHECSKAETQTEHFGAERYFDFVVGKKQESWMRRHDWTTGAARRLLGSDNPPPSWISVGSRSSKSFLTRATM
jgi:hypothetical protein